MDSREVVEAYFKALDQGDLNTVSRYVSADLIFDNPVEAMNYTEFLAFMRGLLGGFPDMKFGHAGLKIHGTEIAAQLKITGTHTQMLALPMPGLKPIKPTQTKVSLPEQYFYYTVRDGKITHIRAEPMPHAGIIGLLEQIGVRLPPIWVMRLVTKTMKRLPKRK